MTECEDNECAHDWVSMKLQCLHMALANSESNSTEEILKRAQAFVDFIFYGTEPMTDNEIEIEQSKAH